MDKDARSTDMGLLLGAAGQRSPHQATGALYSYIIYTQLSEAQLKFR